jgi:hypothetical protein
MRSAEPRWAKFSDDALLALRFRDLRLTIEGSWLEPLLDEVREEMADRGLRFRPYVWLSEEWFSPLGYGGFAVPFYLAHARLVRLERSQMLDVEGGTAKECLRIMRHEAGHALQHAYALHRRKRWRELFGRSSQRYPDYYRPNPASKRHVQHLRLWYAQAHPDEDFAETFAVWLAPRSDWRRRYAGWPALKKLEYVDELMAEIGPTRPTRAVRRLVDPLSRLSTTLGEHYAEKRARYQPDLPNIYDRDLRRLFSERPEHRRRESAAAFIRRHRRELRRLVARWSGEYEFTLDHVLADMIVRCRELRLRAVGSERQLLENFAVLLTVKTMHYLYTPRDWIAL